MELHTQKVPGHSKENDKVEMTKMLDRWMK